MEAKERRQTGDCVDRRSPITNRRSPFVRLPRPMSVLEERPSRSLQRGVGERDPDPLWGPVREATSARGQEIRSREGGEGSRRKERIE